MAVDFNFIDNSDEVLHIFSLKMKAALTAVGMQAEGYAKLKCPVDTGRLRNSISHTVSDDTAYIGTNVEYARYVELGTSRQKAQPYLKPAATEHTAEYKAIMKSIMEG